MKLGMNLLGATEDGRYLSISKESLDYFAAKGFQQIRLPIEWERLQPGLNGELDADYLAELVQTITHAATIGMEVVVNVHNFGYHNGHLIGSDEVPVAAFGDMWGKLAD